MFWTSYILAVLQGASEFSTPERVEAAFQALREPAHVGDEIQSSDLSTVKQEG